MSKRVLWVIERHFFGEDEKEEELINSENFFTTEKQGIEALKKKRIFNRHFVFRLVKYVPEIKR